MPHATCVSLSALICKWHDDVIVDLSQRRAVPVELVPALAIGIEHALVDFGRVMLQPGQERRPEIEADPRVVVHQAFDPAAGIEHPGDRVRRVALGRDPLVPVVIRVG